MHTNSQGMNHHHISSWGVRGFFILMKKIGLFCFLLIASTSLFAQVQEKKDEKAMKAVADSVEVFRKALIDPTKAVLDRLTMDNLSYKHSSGTVENKAQFMEALLSKKSDFVSITLTERKIRIVGASAIVRHNLSAQTNNAGKPGTTNLSVFMMWQKHNGGWKLLSRQATKL